MILFKSAKKFSLFSYCSGFAWESEGDLLAISMSNSPQVIIWDANSQKKLTIDTGLRDPPSCVIWSKNSPVLAIGTSRGNLALYNHLTTRRTPILGKHNKKITCGIWSKENLLALGSEDKTFSISNEEGDSLRVVHVRDIPSDITFYQMKLDEPVEGENTVSMILGRRTLYLYYLAEPDSPTELGFQSKYGQLVQHKWFGDGFVLLGFSLGYLVVISTHPKEMGQELWQIKNHRDSLSCLAINLEQEMVASCGDDNVKIHSMSNLQETTKILTLQDNASLKGMAWSSDGQLLAVTTQQGSLCVFVTQMHTLHAVSPPRIALLTNLTEVTLYHYSGVEKAKQLPNTVTLEIEPSFLAIGPCHLACGMNNHVWFYDLGRSVLDIPMAMGDREYMSEIRQVALNSEYCAALCGGQIMLHSIESNSQAAQEHEPKIFPDEVLGNQENSIQTMALTNDFLVFATDLGTIVHFSLDQWALVLQYRHDMGVKSVFPDTEGARVVVIDEQSQGFVYIPPTEEMIKIPDFSKSTTGVLWDFAHPTVFITFDSKTCFTYVFVRQSIKGKYIEKVGETKLLSDQQPLLLYDGELCLGSSGGKVTSLTLATHKNSPDTKFEQQLELALSLRRTLECWQLCKVSDKREHWETIGKAALHDLDITFALKVFRHIEDAAMVMALENISHLEDVNLLAGNCALLLEDVEAAKNLFARSHSPNEALELCRDLLQWEQAMALAANLSPTEVPYIAREYAQQLEFTGNYTEALVHYEKALRYDKILESEEAVKHTQDHITACKAGIARTSIKSGDYRRGIQLAQELQLKELYKECGEALVSINRSNEASQMMEQAEAWDRAAQLYIQLKQWNRVDTILQHVTSLKLHAQYAAAKEAEGRYTEAINSYQIANDMDSVVRIYIEHLNDPHSASEIVLETRSVEGAKLLAKFYQSIGDHEAAIQFLILCGCVSDAATIASKFNKMRQYGEFLEQYDAAKPADFVALAQYFENEKYTLLTGKYYFLAKEYSRALKHLLKASSFTNEENTALSLAIDCVATSNDDKLANQLIEFLLGESDGVPKDPKVLFRLYMARKQFKEAAKAAVIIANQEQISGNYRTAHDLLFSMYQELRRNNLTVASDMRVSLNLLHRYTLVRIHVRKNDHKLAARLLVQVASNISQFPARKTFYSFLSIQNLIIFVIYRYCSNSYVHSN